MRWLLLSIISLYLRQCDGQQLIPTRIASLPGVIHESSGLIVYTHDLFWTLNDSGGEPMLYGFNRAGSLVDTLRIPGATNRDWEALAFDRGRNRLFIGDIGNNGQARQDLTIYWMEWTAGKVSGPVHQLTYHYPDQTHFPAADNFDAEGLFYWQDSLYLLSKNRRLGAKGYAKLYRLPVDTGHVQAVLLDSLLTQFPVTGAAISPSGSTLALISYGSLLLVDASVGLPLAQCPITRIGIPFSQTEAIDFRGEDTLYFTDEQGSLYRIDRSAWDNKESIPTFPFSLQTNTATQVLELQAVPGQWNGNVQVYNTKGTLQYQEKVKAWPLIIQVANWPNGVYYVQVKAAGRYYTLPFQKG